MSLIAEIGSAFLTIAPSAKGFGSSLNSQVSGETRAAGTSIGRAFGKMFVLGASVIAAAGVGNLLKGSIEEAREAQKVGAATEAIIKATGGAAGLTADQIGGLSSRLSALTGVDDEAIQSGANLLLTFKNVKTGLLEGTDIFERATRAGLDLAATGFGSVESNAKTLGKALNDPVKGMTALTRAGVTFTKAQQERIKGFVEEGNLLGAQRVILGEVEAQVGGVAAATATSGDKAQVALGNLKETIGTALLPVVDRLATTFTNTIAPAITGFIAGMQKGTGAGGQFVSIMTGIGSALVTVGGFIVSYKEPLLAFVGVLTAWSAITKAITTAQLLLNLALSANPIGLIVVGVAALVAGLVLAYNKSETFRDIVNKAFAGVKVVATAVMGFLVKYVPRAFSVIATLVKTYVTVYRTVVTTAFNVVKTVVGAVANFVVSSAQKYGQFVTAVTSKVGQVVKFFKELPGKIRGFVSGIPDQLRILGGAIIDGLKKGIQAGADKVLAAVRAIIDKIPKFIREKLGISSPSRVTTELGRAIGDGLARGIESTTEKVSKATQKLIDKLREKLDSVKSDLSSLTSSVAGAFTGNLFEAETASGFIANLTGTKGQLQGLKAAFTKLIGWGLRPEFLSQLFQSGNAGLILDLAAGSKEQAQDANSLFGEVTSLSNQLGGSIADAKFGDKLDAIRDEIRELRKDGPGNADRMGRVFGREINGAARGGRRRAAA